MLSCFRVHVFNVNNVLTPRVIQNSEIYVTLLRMFLSDENINGLKRLYEAENVPCLQSGSLTRNYPSLNRPNHQPFLMLQ